jgi:hypothetical protein
MLFEYAQSLHFFFFFLFFFLYIAISAVDFLRRPLGWCKAEAETGCASIRAEEHSQQVKTVAL